jgi:hypothetical protein
MGPLKNAKHEDFCKTYVRGEHAGNLAACYQAVYGKANRAAASRLQQFALIRQLMTSD